MTTAKARKVQIGSVSSGTLRTEDLLEAFAWELSYLLGDDMTRSQRNLLAASACFSEHRACPKAARRNNNVDLETNQGEGDALVDELIDALRDLAPPLCYFGTLEGDGADFGFWPDHDRIQEERYQEDGFRWVDGQYEWLPETGVWLEVNDHGNVTVYADDNGNPGAELWSVV